ncbi:MAG: hypothetical protein P9L92_09205 [Candidatus Electryonea clarkiae]|nr:hypothetical protein [Candidatus Electryonea clarkiae]MDP8285356.1 hypothetical protein [Candidatus Electryonea clarkiae]
MSGSKIAFYISISLLITHVSLFAQASDQDSTDTGQYADSLISTESSDSSSKPLLKSLSNRIWGGLKLTWEADYSNILEPGYIAKRVDNFFKPHGEYVGWFPLFDVTSGTRIRAGLGLFYIRDLLSSSVRGIYADHAKYNVEFRTTWNRETIWEKDLQMHLNLLQRLDDDLWFYGIGANPGSDPRSHFRPGTEEIRGKYFQRKRMAMLLTGIRSSKRVEWYFLSQIIERNIHSSGDVSEFAQLRNVFDDINLPGVYGIHSQWYNEITYRFDTRLALWQTEAAYSLEGYTGYTQGISNDGSRLLRFGGDVSGVIPTINEDFVFLPRLVANSVVNLDQEDDIAFYNYPRHPTFRGVSTRYLVRNDEFNFIPSVEQRWHFHKRLSMSVFYDMLFVGDKSESISFDNSPWALGTSFILHGRNEEFGTMQFVYGSEGLRFRLSLGVPVEKNDRWRWK